MNINSKKKNIKRGIVETNENILFNNIKINRKDKEAKGPARETIGTCSGLRFLIRVIPNKKGNKGIKNGKSESALWNLETT